MFHRITAAEGIGSDIKWCSRRKGGKFCLFCGHYAPFEKWSTVWHWHYLLSWCSDSGWGWYYRDYAHTVCYFHRDDKVPGRYKNRGLKEHNLNALLKKGCREDRNCKCASIAQRASWHCPECYAKLVKMAHHYGRPVCDLMNIDRKDIKEDMLVLILSGTF